MVPKLWLLFLMGFKGQRDLSLRYHSTLDSQPPGHSAALLATLWDLTHETACSRESSEESVLLSLNGHDLRLLFGQQERVSLLDYFTCRACD